MNANKPLDIKYNPKVLETPVGVFAPASRPFVNSFVINNQRIAQDRQKRYASDEAILQAAL